MVKASSSSAASHTTTEREPVSEEVWMLFLQLHLAWWQSHGMEGEQLDLEGYDLRGLPFEGAFLKGANLQDSDLSGISLKGLDLSQIDLRRAKLDGADLRRTRLFKAQLQDASLCHVRLDRADLQKAQLQRADLQRADLSHADLRDAQLDHARLNVIHGFKLQLTGAALAHASMQQANLVQASLRSTDLSHADLEGAYLGGADLRGARLHHTWCRGARLDGARLDGTSLRDVCLLELSGQQLQAQGATFHRVQLQKADLRGARLQEALFSHVQLEEAQLQGAQLGRSQWLHSTWQSVALADADVVGARLDQETVQSSGWSRQQTALWLDRGGTILADIAPEEAGTASSPAPKSAEGPDLFATGGGRPTLPPTQHPEALAQHGADVLMTKRPSAVGQGMILQGRYQVERQLGVGGMGEVFLCTDLQCHKRVAIKLLHAALSHHPELVKRFAREIALSETMEHPGLLKCADLQRDEETGRLFFAMPYLKGETLAARLKALERGLTLPHSTTLRYLDALADILDYAHELGVIHRDVKPSNVMIAADGQLKLMDFGIAYHSQGEQTLYSQQGGPGTYFYTAPEQLRGHVKITPKADIFSLGVLAYHMLAGDIPMGIPEPISARNRHIPDAVDSVVFQAMAAQPERRHPSCATFVSALRGALEAQM